MNWQSLIIPRLFYDRNPIVVAQELLGTFLVRRINNTILVGMITETEAYLPTGDSAAHSFKGKTKRNASLYKEAGHTYVHSMRQYNLLDIVTEGTDKPGSVLIRAIEPIEGTEEMKHFRKSKDIEGLTNGPGKVCIALAITRDLDGVDITSAESPIFIARADKIKNESSRIIETSSRIGISAAKDMLLRFHISENSHVSKRYSDSS